MQAVIGFVLGIATVILLKEYPACVPRKTRRVCDDNRKRAERAYENFLSYNGDEQEG